MLAGCAMLDTNHVNQPRLLEHRSWQQLQMPLTASEGGLSLSTRLRLEQRYPDTGGPVGWRLRAQLRGQLRLDRITLLAWTESFIGLNETPWGQRSGIDQWRIFMGVQKPLSRQLNLEAGYLNQHVVRTGPDRVNNVFSTSLIYRFG